MSTEIVAYLLGPAGAAGLTLLLILTGVLVLGRDHKKVLRQVEKLQEANDIQAKSIEQLQEVNRTLSSSGQLTNQVITAMMEIAMQRGMPQIPSPTIPPKEQQNPVVP